MLFHLRADLGPTGTAGRYLDRIRRALFLPKNRGRILYSKLQILNTPAKRFAYAQEWLAINQDAPIDAKIYHQGLAEEALSELDPEYRYKISSALADRPRVPLDIEYRAKTWAKKITAPLTEEFVKVYETKKQAVAVKVTPLDEAVARVRDAYVLAKAGDYPDISAIMVEQGLIDQDGESLVARKDASGTKVPLTEALVRERQLAEDWRGQRARHIHRVFDVIPDEVKLVTIAKAVAMHKDLYQHFQAISHLLKEYYQSGKMMALKDRATPLDLPPNPGILVALAESMRKMFDFSGEKVTITLQQAAISQAAQTEGAKADVEISLTSKQYMASLESMSQEELDVEIANLDRMRGLLEAPPAAPVENGGQPTPPTIDP